MHPHPTSDAERSPPASSLSASVCSGPRLSQTPTADIAKLREALARTAKPALTPAMEFGRFARREMERSPEQVEGMFAVARLLKCDPTGREIESLKRDVADLKTLAAAQASTQSLAGDEMGGRKAQKSRGGEKKVTKSKTEKRVKKANASKLLRQMEKEVLRDIREEFDHPTESTLTREAAERLYSKSDSELTQMLHERYDFPTTGRKTLSRTNVYISWARYRTRGNAGRLDPASPAIEATSAGGESSKSGATRNTDYAASNGLYESKFRKIPTLDAKGRRNINDDQEGKAFLRANPDLFSEHLDAAE